MQSLQDGGQELPLHDQIETTVCRMLPKVVQAVKNEVQLLPVQKQFQLNAMSKCFMHLFNGYL